MKAPNLRRPQDASAWLQCLTAAASAAAGQAIAYAIQAGDGCRHDPVLDTCADAVLAEADKLFAGFQARGGFKPIELSEAVAEAVTAPEPAPRLVLSPRSSAEFKAMLAQYRDERGPIAFMIDVSDWRAEIEAAGGVVPATVPAPPTYVRPDGRAMTADDIPKPYAGPKVDERRLGWWQGLGQGGLWRDTKAHAAVLGEPLAYYLCGQQHHRRDERFSSRDPYPEERCPGCAERVELAPSTRIPRDRVEWVQLTYGDTPCAQYHAFDKSGPARPAPCGTPRHSTGHVEASPPIKHCCLQCFRGIDYPPGRIADGTA